MFVSIVLIPNPPEILSFASVEKEKSVKTTLKYKQYLIYYEVSGFINL